MPSKGELLPATDIGHSGGHHGHELDVGLEREVGHVEDRVGYMANVHSWLRQHSAVGLWDSGLHPLAHFRGGIAYIDLSAGDVVFAAVQRDRFRKSGGRVFGGRIRSGVWPRRMRGDGAVIDDAAATWILSFHQQDGPLCAEERAGQINGDDRIPLLERNIFHRLRRAADSSVDALGRAANSNLLPPRWLRHSAASEPDRVSWSEPCRMGANRRKRPPAIFDAVR
jgi:hypothetical protein